MKKQQNAPVLHPFSQGGVITMPWQRWFQKLKTVDDEIKRPPANTYTADHNIKTNQLGTVLLFNVGTSDVTANLPAIQNNDKWAWLTIIRMGTGDLIITATNSNRIEWGSPNGSIICREQKRRAANVTLQIISDDTWAVLAGMGIWDID